MTTAEMIKAPHAPHQPMVSMLDQQIGLAEAYRLKAVQDERDDFRIHYENQLRVLREQKAA